MVQNIDVGEAETQLYPKVRSGVPPPPTSRFVWTHSKTSETYIEARAVG